LSEAGNTYIFEVPAEANRHTVARAVEAQYEVGVKKVRMVKVPGKTKRSIRRGRTANSSRSDIRKAYVTLNEGDKLPIFSSVEEPAKEAK
jgi:ribosomal protein L23